MKDFMFLFFSPENELSKLSEDESKKLMDKWGVWIKKLNEQGRYKDGDRLSRNEIRTIVGKEKIVTDGPYPETKELVGGYILVQAENIDEATEIAKDCPIFQLNGNLEIRTSLST